MAECGIFKKNTYKLITLKGKDVCKEFFTESIKEDLDTGNLDFGTCI